MFGPKQEQNSPNITIIPNFINAILKNKQPVIYSDDGQTRDFVYVGDVAQANIKACESNFNEVINIASAKRIIINKLYEIVKKTIETEINVKYIQERLDDIKHSQADISNLKKIRMKINAKNFEQLIEKNKLV